MANCEGDRHFFIKSASGKHYEIKTARSFPGPEWTGDLVRRMSTNGFSEFPRRVDPKLAVVYRKVSNPSRPEA